MDISISGGEATLVASLIAILGGVIGFVVRHYLYEREILEIIFDARIEEHPDCVHNEFYPHDYRIVYDLKIFNLGKRAIHLTKIDGTGIDDLRPKFRVDFYGDIDPFYKEVNDEIGGNASDDSFVTKGLSVKEELDADLICSSAIINVDAPPFEFNWAVKVLGEKNLPKKAHVNVYTARQNTGVSKHFYFPKVRNN